MVSEADRGQIRRRVLEFKAADAKATYTHPEVYGYITDLEWCLDEVERLLGEIKRLKRKDAS